MKLRLTSTVAKGMGALATAGLLVHERKLIGSSFGALGDVRWTWLAVAIALEMLSLASFAGIFARLLRAGSTRVPYLPVVKTIWAGTALSGTVPLAGSQLSVAFTFRRFKDQGVEPAVAAWSLALAGIASSSASALLLVGGALISGNGLAAAAGTAGALFGVLTFALALLAMRRPAVLSAIIRPLGWVLGTASGRVGRKIDDPESLLRATAVRMAAIRIPATGWMLVGATALANWVADMAALAASIAAVGSPVPWRGLMLAYTIGTGAAAIGLVPGGLGIVEAALAVALMEVGVRHPVALAAVLLYRLISFWMVNAVGWLAYLSFGRTARRVRGSITPSHRPAALHPTPDVSLDHLAVSRDQQRHLENENEHPCELREQHVA